VSVPLRAAPAAELPPNLLLAASDAASLCRWAVLPARAAVVTSFGVDLAADGVLRELRRALRPGGVLLTFMRGSQQSRQRHAAMIERYGFRVLEPRERTAAAAGLKEQPAEERKTQEGVSELADLKQLTLCGKRTAGAEAALQCVADEAGDSYFVCLAQ
jgi:hypothetical protein